MVERICDEMFEESFDGPPEEPPDESPEDPRDKLLKICGRLFRDLEKCFQKTDAKMSESLATLAETIEELYESDDPRSNGWVGDDGLP